MKCIKDEIKSEFENEYQQAIVNLFFTNNYMAGLMKSKFECADLTRQQYNILRILRGQYPNAANINLIKERMLDKMSDASRIVKRLLKKELVSEVSNSIDKRSTLIKINEKGLELLKRVDAYTLDKDMQNFSNFSKEEALQLSQLLDKLRNNFETLNDVSE